MRPLLSRTMRRSFASVKLPPLAIGRDHSVASVRLNGAPALGETKMLSIRPLVPPSATPLAGCAGCCALTSETALNAHITTAGNIRLRILTSQDAPSIDPKD